MANQHVHLKCSLAVFTLTQVHSNTGSFVVHSDTADTALHHRAAQRGHTLQQHNETEHRIPSKRYAKID